MKSIYLISGSYVKEGFPQDISDCMKEEINDNYSFCFIPTKFDEIDKNNERCNKILTWFKDKDILFKKYFVIDDRLTSEEAINIIKESDVIFLTGGDTLRQIDGINKLKIKDVLHNSGKVIIGMSAGAINMAKNVVLTKDIEDNIPETCFYEGIGVTDINIEPHCDFSDKEHFNDLLEASKKSKIICMKDNCSIKIKDNETEIFGNYSIINNGIIIYDNL